MAKRSRLEVALCALFFFFLIQQALAQAPHRTGFKPGVRFEYFSRTIGWDEDKTTDLSAYQASLVLEYEIQRGLTLAGLIGYSSSNFGGLIFRQLPFSFEVPAAGINGLLFGGEIGWNFFPGKAFQVGAHGQFLANLGLKKTWKVSDYAVPGTLEGQPTWMRASVGPILSYRASNQFVPYLYPSFNYLWGTFAIEEKFKSLTGDEKKEIKGKSLFGIALGSTFDLSERFLLKAEAGLYPFKGGTDYSLMLQAQYSY